TPTWCSTRPWTSTTSAASEAASSGRWPGSGCRRWSCRSPATPSTGPPSRRHWRPDCARSAPPSGRWSSTAPTATTPSCSSPTRWAPPSPSSSRRSSDMAELHPETRAIRAGRADNDGALAPILWSTTTFVTPTVDEGRRMATATDSTHFYSRYGNPTVRAFEDALADLEGAEAARAFASGMGAISSVVLALCSPGDHVVAQRQLYGGTAQLLTGVCPRFGIEVTFVDATEPGAFEAAVRPGKTVLVLA